jgi:type II secretory pathway component PulF
VPADDEADDLDLPLGQPVGVGQIAAAEAGGNLPEALTRLASWYSDRVDYLAARVGAMLEPFFILFLAGMAGWIAFGVFFPLVAIIQSLSGGSP